MVQGRVLQDAWNLLFFSIIAISVAATLKQRHTVVIKRLVLLDW
jgi:hypothetical protein